MTIEREKIYSALFNLWPTVVDGIATSSRRLRHWSEVTAQQQPALFQVEGDGVPSRVKGLPTKWVLGAILYLYTHCGDNPDDTPSIQANNVLDAIEKALDYDTRNCFQTLGGLVSEVRMSGHIKVDEGILGPQSVMQIFIEVVVA